MPLPAIQSFNTGRQYTAQGQRIAFSVIDIDTDDSTLAISRVAFVDVDRMITGVLKIAHHRDDQVHQKDVMSSYDAGGYTWLSDQRLKDQLTAAASAL